MSNKSGYDYEQSVGSDMDISYFETLSQKKNNEIHTVRIHSHGQYSNYWHAKCCSNNAAPQ